MKEYAIKTASEKKKTHSQLEQIASNNKEALEKIGVKNIEELVDNPEFAADEEIVAYKQAEKQEENVRLSDAQLKKRLADFDINISDENFSYETASDEIGRRLENLNNELLAEKLKTPEGREEAINSLVKEFSETTGQLKNFNMSRKVYSEKNRDLDQNETGDYCQLSLGNSEVRVEFFGDKAVLNDFYNLRLLPPDWAKKTDKYGQEVAQEALKQNYNQKLEEVFNSPDRLQGKAKEMRAALEVINPEKRYQAIESLSAFKTKRDEVFKLLQEKSEELKSQGINFSAEYNSDYGMKYEEIFELGHGYRGQVETVIEVIRSNDNNSLYDFDNITVVAQQRVSDLDQALKTIQNIKTKEDVSTFSNSNLRDLHDKYLNCNFEKYAVPELPPGIFLEVRGLLKDKDSSYKAEVWRLDKEIAELEEMKNKIAEKIGEAVDYKITEHDLHQKYGHNSSRQSLEDMIKRIECVREEANKGLLAIAELQTKLPANENLIVRGITVEAPAKREAARKIIREIYLKEEELNQKRADLNQQKELSPWFGKGKWRQKIDLLEQEIKELTAEIAKLKAQSQQEKHHIYYIDIKNARFFYDQVEDLFKKYSATGQTDEVFVELQKSLQTLADKEAPADAKVFLEKLTALEKKLTAKD